MYIVYFNLTRPIFATGVQEELPPSHGRLLLLHAKTPLLLLRPPEEPQAARTQGGLCGQQAGFPDSNM